MSSVLRRLAELCHECAAAEVREARGLPAVELGALL